jgi:hypothetical protein
MRAEVFAQLVYTVMKASGDPATEWWELPRLAVLREIGLQGYLEAERLLHADVHRQNIGEAERRHDSSQCPTLEDSVSDDLLSRARAGRSRLR